MSPSPESSRTSVEIASAYVAGLSASDAGALQALRSDDFVLEFVHGDAFEDPPRSAREAELFWPRWFVAFPEMDLEVIRTIAADEVVVTQWIFTGTNSGPLESMFGVTRIEPTGNTVRLRGVTFLDIHEGRIIKETTYFDVATLLIELGVRL